MIGTIDIKLNAASPNLPLAPFYTFIGSPSHVRVLNAPKAIGSWQLTAVYVTVNYPDNTSSSVAAVKTAGVWSATLPAPTSTGTSLNGFTVTADGVDENGAAVTGYVLGKGDAYVLDTDSTLTVGETTYYLHLLDAEPETPHKGDICLIDGAWQLYNGTKWVVFGGGGGTSDYDDLENKPQIEGVTLEGNVSAADLAPAFTTDNAQLVATIKASVPYLVKSETEDETYVLTQDVTGASFPSLDPAKSTLADVINALKGV